MSDNFFGKIEEDWAGYSSEYYFFILGFEKDVDVFLGAEFTVDGEDIESAPTDKQVQEYEKTMKSFIDNVDSAVAGIRDRAFKRYKEKYAPYYEASFKVEAFFKTDMPEGSVHEALGLNTPEKHFEYMKDILYLRILDDNIIKILIDYDLDREHGMEITLKNNKVYSITGIGE